MQIGFIISVATGGYQKLLSAGHRIPNHNHNTNLLSL